MPHLSNEVFLMLFFVLFALEIYTVCMIEYRMQKLREAEAKAEERRKKFLEQRSWHSMEAERLYYKSKLRIFKEFATVNRSAAGRLGW